MMLEIAIGDAYGAGFEYVPREVITKHNKLEKYIQHQKHTSLKPGSYTDDTQMSIAIAELLLEGKEWHKYNIANKFVECFKRDQREGYAGAFYDFLVKIKDGNEFIEKIKPESEKNGAAMRASAIGYLKNTSEVIEYSRTQAKLTHFTEIGINSAVASSLMSHYFIHNLGKKEDLANFIQRIIPVYDWKKTWQGKVGASGYEAVHAALTSIKKHDSLSEILKDCINYGGDVDTVGAIAMGAASNSREISQDLPIHLFENLENEKYGRDYLINLDKKLKEKFM